MTNPAYRKAAFAPDDAGTSANAVDAGRYGPERLCDAADRAFQQPVSASPYLADCNGRQPELPQRLLTLLGASAPQNGGSWRHLALGVAGWMRYTQGVDESRERYVRRG